MNDDMIIDLYWTRSESAISETYLNLWNAIPPQRPTIFLSFLGRVTRNLSLNRYKERNAKKRGRNEIELSLSELEDCISSRSSVELVYEAGVVAKKISSFLYSIDSENRIVFVRRYWYVDSIATISARFGISESKVKSMLFRTRKKLRDYLKREGIII